MKRILYTALAAAIALSSTFTSYGQTLSPEIHFQLVQQTLIVVSLQVNGQGPFDFLLDTGNDITIIDPSLATKLDLLSSGQILQTSLSGIRKLRSSTLETLALGSAQRENVSVLVENLAFLRQIAPHLQGVIGQDFLSHFNYLLDYRKRTIRLESGSEVGGTIEGTLVHLEPRQDLGRDKMIVVADAYGLNHSSLRLVLDSGATAVVLMRNASQRLQIPLREDQWEQTPAGSSVVHSGSLHLLEIGTAQVHSVTAVISSAAAAPFGDGLLPTSLFGALYFNNRENFVIFDPHAKRGSPRL